MTRLWCSADIPGRSSRPLQPIEWPALATKSAYVSDGLLMHDLMSACKSSTCHIPSKETAFRSVWKNSGIIVKVKYLMSDGALVSRAIRNLKNESRPGVGGNMRDYKRWPESNIGSLAPAEPRPYTMESVSTDDSFVCN